MRTGYLLILMFLLFLFSCRKENEEAVVLLSPLELYIPAETAEVVLININCSSPNELTEFIIKSRMEGGYSQTELDTSISGKKFHLLYEYLVPMIEEKTNIILEFELHDASNAVVSNYKVIEATPVTVFLTETAGNEIYSEHSGKQNGFNLISGTPVYLNLSDSSEVHFADTTNTDILLNRWISPAGIMFVRFNGLDYANCTNLTARAAYDAGLKLEMLNNLSEGDIYITKLRSKDLVDIYPVIKITDIIDDPGNENDRYVFNIKK